MLKQITVFLENKPGRMEEVTGCLAKVNINLHALSLADTTDFGILRIIVSDTEKAMTVLKDNNFMAKTTDVIAVALDHNPGSLHKVLRMLNAPDISIEYIYAFTSRHKDYDAIVILSVGNQAAVIKKLDGSGLFLLDDSLLEQINQL
jgi:ACT domain-containing protein